MPDTSKPEDAVLDHVTVIAEAWAAIKKDFRFYLRWGMVPLLFFISPYLLRLRFLLTGTISPSPLFLPFSLERIVLIYPHGAYQQESEIFLVIDALFLVLYILSLLCFSVRVYRHILLHDGPDQNFFAQMFSGRVWKCFGKQLLVGLKWCLYALPFALLAIGIFYAAIYALSRLPFSGPLILDGKHSSVSMEEGVGWTLALYGAELLVAVAGFAFIAEQVVLIGPDVAVDGEASFSRLKRLAGRHRKRITWIMFVIAIAPQVLKVVTGIVQFVDIENAVRAGTAFDSGHIKQISLNVLSMLFHPAWWVMSLFASAVIYKRLIQSVAAAAVVGAPLAKGLSLSAMDKDE